MRASQSKRIFVGAMAIAITFAATTFAATPEQKCAVAKTKAAAKKIGAKLKCRQKAILESAATFDPDCLATVEAKFLAAIEKAESKGGCVVTGDAQAIEDSVDSCVAGISELTSPTSGGGAFDCSGVPLPTTAPATITIDGTVTDSSGAPIADVPIEVRNEPLLEPVLASTTTDSSGQFSMSVATGGTPVDGYLRVDLGLFRVYYQDVPASPWADDVTESVVVLHSFDIGVLQFLTGLTQASDQAFIKAVVVDCDGVPLSNATVSCTPAATVRYNDGSGTPSATASSTASDGVAYLFNVPVGPVTCGGAAGTGLALRQHTILAFPGATETVITP